MAAMGCHHTVAKSKSHRSRSVAFFVSHHLGFCDPAADSHFAAPLGLLVDHEFGTLHRGVDMFRLAEARGC